MKLSNIFTNLLASFTLVFLFMVPSAHATAVIYDNDELFTADQIARLMNAVSTLELEYQVGVLTIDDYTGNDFFYAVKNTYAPQYFEDDHMFLAISMDTRDVMVVTNGSAEEYFRNTHVDALRAEITPYLTAGDVYTASYEFLVSAVEKPPFYEGKETILLSSIGASLLIAVGVTIFQVRGMNTIRAENAAKAYLNQSEFSVTRNRETFLYRNITKTVKSQSSGSGGGGGGGGSRGGSAGKF
ncbi:MAG: TPM domain-containing protein [Eubacteriales bacterium]